MWLLFFILALSLAVHMNILGHALVYDWVVATPYVIREQQKWGTGYHTNYLSFQLIMKLSAILLSCLIYTRKNASPIMLIVSLPNLLMIKSLLHLRVKMCKRMDQRPPWHRHIDIDVAISFSLFLNPSSHQRSSSPSRGISWTTEQSQWAKNPPMVSDISITSSSFVTSHSDPGDLEIL